MILSGCGNGASAINVVAVNKPVLPAVPDRFKRCFFQWPDTSQMAPAEIIEALEKTANRRGRCGQALIAWYGTVRAENLEKNKDAPVTGRETIVARAE